MNRDDNMVIVNNYDGWIFTATTEKRAERDIVDAIRFYSKRLEEARVSCAKSPGKSEFWQKYIAQYSNILDAGFEAISWKEYEDRQATKYLAGEPEEISEAKYYEMMDTLPPLNMCTYDGVNMFCMSEMTSGSYTTQCAHDKATDKYYWKTVDSRDPSTWIVEYLRGRKTA